MKFYRKQFTILLLTLIFVFGGCGKEMTSKNSNDSNNHSEDVKGNESNNNEENREEAKKEDFTVNNLLYRNSTPDDFTKDWESMKFLYNSEVFDILGKTLRAVTNLDKVMVEEGAKEVEAGQTIDVGISFNDNNSYHELPITVKLINLKSEDIPIEEGIITEVGLRIGGVEKQHPGKNHPPYLDGYILPKGLAPFDKESRITELYGEPKEIGKAMGGLAKYYLYESKDKKNSMYITIPLGEVQEVKLVQKIVPEIAEKLKHAKGVEDFTKGLNKDSYVNINGHKVKMYSKFKDTFDALSLVSYGFKKEDAEKQMRTSIKAKNEVDFKAKIPGFSNYTFTFRLYNPGKESVHIMASTIIGISVKEKSDNESKFIDISAIPDPSELDLERGITGKLNIVGPYGVKLGEQIKKAFKKLPNNATEKVIKNGQGGYFSNNVKNMHMKVIVAPVDGNELVNEILLTVKNVKP